MNATSVVSRPRKIDYRTTGSSHGPITRLVSPGDLGELLKPFVFLDHFDFRPGNARPEFGMHPHSGIATLTFLIEGEVRYEDTTGKAGLLSAGSVEWMRAGKGMWHSGALVGDGPVRGFQLWIALPATEESAPAESIYLPPSKVPEAGPARVLLGRYGGVQSSIAAPAPMNYLAVRLDGGQSWRYAPPAGHTVAWMAVAAGRVRAAGPEDAPIGAGELAVFEESEQAIDLVAHEDATLVIGSATKHPYELVLGRYSVHTSQGALEHGEAEIRRIGARLR